MPYITREDGEHFVIPSYRDVLSSKNKTALKKEIMSLSQSYGEYITMQRKGAARYEVAFSPDTGYLLGESVWHHFNHPTDMIYCEAVPNTTEAILVIVKAGSVYLDGSFPIDSVPEELVIFLTQENNFEIYTYGDVSISKEPEDGKFSFEANSVKSFTVLDKPVFPTLPLLKQYQFQLVDNVLRSHGIGGFPTKQIFAGIIVIGAAWMAWSYFSTEEVVVVEAPEVNPYQGYIDSMRTPAPEQQINDFLNKLKDLYVLPGWQIRNVIYTTGGISATVTSNGAKVETLMNWAKQNDASVSIQQNGFSISMTIPQTPRSNTSVIYPLKTLIVTMVDRLSTIYPGNNLQLADMTNKGVYSEAEISINFNSVSPLLLRLIAEQVKDLPLVLKGITLSVENGSLSGKITFQALGS